MNSTEEIHNTPQNQVCFSSFKRHWAEAQIDGPMHVVARYDDVAKLLITIGGFLLGVMASGYSAMLRDRTLIDPARAKGKSVLVFSLMLIFFLSAAMVCFQQPKMRAAKILQMRDDHELEEYIVQWCNDLLRTIKWKRVCLTIATLSFIASFLTMISLLINMF